jgi:hypothetical protein
MSSDQDISSIHSVQPTATAAELVNAGLVDRYKCPKCIEALNNFLVVIIFYRIR